MLSNAGNTEHKIILSSNGISTDKYFVPPFTLSKGELVVIYLYNGAHFRDTEEHLVNIFTGKLPDEKVKIHQPLSFVSHFKEPAIRRIFYPVTVGEYLKKHAAANGYFATEIYKLPFIKKHTKVNTLTGNPRKLLSLYATLSKTNTIIFDLVGQDPVGADETYDIVKEVVRRGGAAILLDGFDEKKHDCSQFITLEWRS